MATHLMRLLKSPLFFHDRLELYYLPYEAIFYILTGGDFHE